MVRLRLKRMGTKKRPFYRVVAADARSGRDGRVLDQLGFYHPISPKEEFRLDKEKIDAWLKKGAQPTDTVKRILNKNKIYLSYG